MNIYPAIDILGGNAVRLTNGDYSRGQVFSTDPAAQARSFAECGAKYLHVVDLDGARDGMPVNAEVIKRIASENDMFIEVGGGMRTLHSMEAYIEAGAQRVIIGSAAVENFTLVTDAVKFFGDKLAVGVDALNGKVAIHGWKQVTDTDAYEFCLRLKESGVRTVIYTDISKDGALSGTNLQLYGRLTQINGLNIIASGGITYYEELAALKDMGVSGAIVGRAVYEGALDLKKLLAEYEGCSPKE